MMDGINLWIVTKTGQHQYTRSKTTKGSVNGECINVPNVSAMIIREDVNFMHKTSHDFHLTTARIIFNSLCNVARAFRTPNVAMSTNMRKVFSFISVFIFDWHLPIYRWCN